MPYDSAPEGWSGTVEAMKGHASIDNPFALAHWMASEGYHPHDVNDVSTLDAACEMYRAAGHDDHDDGAAYLSAMGKPTETAQPDLYENQTENVLPFNEENEDETSAEAPMFGPDSKMTAADDDESLLDEYERDGENNPTTEAPPSDPAVKSVPEGVSSKLGDPSPEDLGAEPIDIEGEEANDA